MNPLQIIHSFFLSAFLLDPAMSASEALTDNSNCPMNVRALMANEDDVVFHNFDQSRAEEIAVFKNGDVLIARFNPNCDLGFDASFFKRTPYRTVDEKRRIAALLIKLFRNSENHNRKTETRLKSIRNFETTEFKISVNGIRLDEQHLLRLVDIAVSPDIDSQMFDSVMSYSWVPPSGE